MTRGSVVPFTRNRGGRHEKALDNSLVLERRQLGLDKCMYLRWRDTHAET